MKKLLVIFLILGIYLNRSYAYFYNFLAQKHLVAPVHNTTTNIGNNPGKQTTKYAALGDSLTAGVGVLNYEQSYPYLVAQNLSAKENIELFNFAQAGATSYEVLSYQLPQVLAIKPDFITLLIGVNDIHNLISAKQFEENYTRIIAVLKNSKTKIYVLSLPYLGSEKIVFFPYNFLLDFRTKQFNKVIKKISQNYGVEYIDLYQPSKGTNFYSSDQFHPADQGYKEWVTKIYVN